MNDHGFSTSLVMGTGGSQPGVWVLPCGGDRAMNVLELPAGHSVYAIDMDAENGLTALGTRAGTIEILSWPQGSGPAPMRIMSLHQGAPVLSVCLLGPSRLASTDIAGRLLLWDLDGDADRPQACDTGDELICSLLALPGNRLVGLSASGHLVFWDQALRRPEQSLIGPRPPATLSLVRLQYWPQYRAVVYPGAHGRLAMYTPDRPGLQVWDAHDGEFYAILVEADGLHTIGRTDGLMKLWSEPAGTPVRQSKAPTGVIAGASFGDASSKALLIHDSFEAAVYALRSDPLRPIGWLGASSYRSVAGPSARLRQTTQDDRRQALVDSLQAQILEKIQSQEFEDIETLHEQLTALGFESISLALRAQRAAMQQDLLGEMRIRRRLVRTLPPQDASSWPALLRYAEVLEAAWCLAEAKEIRASIPPEQQQEPAVLEWLERADGIMKGDDWVAACPTWPALIEAASEFERPFTGRWAVAELGRYSLACPRKLVNAEVLAAKYEQIRREHRSSGQAPAKSGRFWWLAPLNATSVELVVFGEPSDRGPALRIAAQIQEHGTECMVLLRGLLDAGQSAPDQSWSDHNRRLLALAAQATQPGPLSAWPRPVREMVNLALRRLRNLARSHRLDEEEL